MCRLSMNIDQSSDASDDGAKDVDNADTWNVVFVTCRWHSITSCAFRRSPSHSAGMWLR